MQRAATMIGVKPAQPVGKEPSATVLILAYHSIDSSGSVISTSPEKFREQMEQIHRSGFSTLPLGEIVRRLHEKTALPPRGLAITFDDGYRNFHEQAWPVLTRYGLPATVFLIPGLSGMKNHWPGQAKGIPDLDLLDWPEITEMARHGIEFGAHAWTHADLSLAPLSQARDEILRSKHTIEDRLARPVQLFAWPFGRQRPELLSLIHEQFGGVCSTAMGFVAPGGDPYDLPRIEMYYFAGNNRFSRLGTPGFARYVSFRGRLRTLRARFAR